MRRVEFDRRVRWKSVGAELHRQYQSDAKMASSLPFPDFGLNTDDVRYFHMDSVVQGRGPNRLKYLDMEGRWKLSGKSIPYISAAFNHLQRLNDAAVPMRDLDRAPLNAIGMVSWTSSARAPEKAEKAEKKELTILKPEVEIREVIPPSPREPVPHRSAGYGLAHQKRKLSIPDRSRSPSLSSRNESPTPEFDKFSKYQRKDSNTAYGTRYGSPRDLGYISNDDRQSSGAPSPNDKWTVKTDRLPHRTQALSPRPSSRVAHDSQYDPTYLNPDRQFSDELSISVKDTSKYYSEKPISSYRDQYLRKTYEVSPKSTGSTDYSSGSELNSPNKRSPRTAEEYLLEAYHYKSTHRDEPRRSRLDWSPRY